MSNYISVKDLPDAVKVALEEIGYHKKDIGVSSNTKYQLGGASGDGQREFCIAINLLTGETKQTLGSWGGANMFNPKNAVDLDRNVYDLPENFAIINGSQGGYMYASLTVHPNNIQKLLPKKAEISGEEKSALLCCSYKSGYKAEAFKRAGLGDYSAENPIIKSLEVKGLVKINKSGGIQITTEGKNAR